MKNKKGFTLIELLAVIVVLAIIALITIPQVLGMTDKAKESANLRSVEGHIENMNNSIASLVFESGIRDGIYTFDEFNFSTFPKKDHIRCEKYEVKKSTIVKAVNCLINDKKYCYDNEGISCEGKYDSGTIGTVTWDFDYNTKTLNILGSGAMEHYTEENLAPWNKYKNDIKKIVIGEDITRLGKYAFYDLVNVEEIRIDSKTLSDLSKTTVDGANYGNSFTFAKVGSNTSGTKAIFGPKITNIPAWLFKNAITDTALEPNITSVSFEGNNIKNVYNGAFMETKISAINFPEGITNFRGDALKYTHKLKMAILPDNVTAISNYMIISNSLEKLVFGAGTTPIFAGIGRYSSLKTMVIPEVSSTSGGNWFLTNNRVDIYGNSSTEEWINNIKTKTGQTNLYYHLLSEYKSTVTLSTGVTEEVDYNGTYQFTTDKEVDIKHYYDASDGKRYYADAYYTKTGNTYTINHIKADVYIDIK